MGENTEMDANKLHSDLTEDIQFFIHIVSTKFLFNHLVIQILNGLY